MYFTHEGAHFYIVEAFCLFLPWYLKIGMFFVMLRAFMCDITYMSQKNQSAGGIKRSKHDYCNSFNNEMIKLYMSLETL